MQISYETKWGQSGISNRFFQKFTNYKSSHDNVSTFVQMICGICKFQAYRPLGSRACHGTPDFGRSVILIKIHYITSFSFNKIISTMGGGADYAHQMILTLPDF